MSPRNRKDPADAWVPKRVYRMKTKWYFVPRAGKKVPLAPLDAKPAAVLKAYNDYMASLDTEGTVAALIDAYLASPQFKSRSAATQKGYQHNADLIKRVFGQAHVDEVTPQDVRQFMDKRGQQSETAANREKAFLSLVYSWGYERGQCQGNPCKGVRKFTETARDRYVEDWEFDLVRRYASPRLQAAMTVLYLTAMRKKDLRKLMRQDLRDDGVFVQQSKTGTKQLKEWTPELRQAINQALAMPSTHPTMYVFHNIHGGPLSDSSLNNDWREAWAAAREEVPTLARFTIHDLKAKGISDFEGDKQLFSGHKTQRQVDTYDRKVRRTPTLIRKQKGDES